MSWIECPKCAGKCTVDCPNSKCDNGRIQTSKSMPFLDDVLHVNSDEYENCNQCGGTGEFTCPVCDGLGEIEVD